MSDDVNEKIEQLQKTVAQTIQAHWKLFLIQGVVMMILGLAAVAVPHVATIAIEILLGVLFFVGGIFRVLTLFQAKTAPGFWMSLFTAVLAVLLGLALVMHPMQGVITLTIVLVAFFIVEGIAVIIAAIAYRDKFPGWGWSLVTGVVDLVLAYLIWRGWPSSADWAIGLLAGINMLFFGLSLTMTAIAARTMGDNTP